MTRRSAGPPITSRLSRPSQAAPMPRIAALTPWLGQPSNVWMYRQFEQLADQLTTIITWQSLNQDQFPLPDTEVRLVPPAFAEPLRGLPRTLDAFLNPRSGGSRYGGAFVRWLKTQLRDCGAEALLGQFGPWAMVGEQACRRLGIPAFVHFHGFDISTALSKRRYRRSLESHWHDFAGMIVVAEYQRQTLLRFGVDPESIALIPCGAPVKPIADAVAMARRQTPKSPGEFVFLFVGRFTEKKDPLAVLNAFQICHQNRPQARLVMGGFGPLMDDCHQWLRGKPIELRRAISFPGKLTPNEVIEALAHADALVQHSRTAISGDKEGWPVVIGEAMAASLPIVATRHAGIVDQVVEEHNGLLCDEGDWRRMGADMTRLAGDPRRSRTMGAASYQRILHFDSAIQIEKLRRFINRRVSDRKSRLRRAA